MATTVIVVMAINVFVAVIVGATKGAGIALTAMNLCVATALVKILFGAVFVRWDTATVAVETTTN